METLSPYSYSIENTIVKSLSRVGRRQQSVDVPVNTYQCSTLARDTVYASEDLFDDKSSTPTNLWLADLLDGVALS